jgi:hypothetical protein
MTYLIGVGRVIRDGRLSEQDKQTYCDNLTRSIETFLFSEH